MSKPAGTARGVQSLLNQGKEGSYSAGDGLYLRVNCKGGGSWIFRYQLNKKRRQMGLGSVSGYTLAQARSIANAQRELLAQGIDPIEERKRRELEEQASRITFDEVAADFIASRQNEWTGTKHAQQWKNTLKKYASPIIGHLPPADIKTEHILKVLTPIWETKQETANRVRNRIEQVLNAAKVRRLRDGENVATWRGHLELLLPRVRRKQRHHPALRWTEVPLFWDTLAGDTDISAQALQLKILTAVRTSEVLGACWDEFDLQSKVWTIPAERMKTGKAHRVPLSNAAIELLERIPLMESRLLFEGRKQGQPLSKMSMLMKCRRMDKDRANGKGWKDANGETITPHGFRSTFRDWAAENTTFQNIVVEQALAHSIGNAVEAAYRRGDLLERRRELMEAWGRYVTQSQQGKVIELRGMQR